MTFPDGGHEDAERLLRSSDRRVVLVLLEMERREVETHEPDVLVTLAERSHLERQGLLVEHERLVVIALAPVRRLEVDVGGGERRGPRLLRRLQQPHALLLMLDRLV